MQSLICLETSYVVIIDKSYIDSQRKFFSKQLANKQQAILDYFIDLKKKSQLILNEEFKMYNLQKDIVITENIKGEQDG